MSTPSETFASLVAQLEANEITKDQFKRASAKLVDSIGEGLGEAQVDPVKLESIDAAASMLRNL
jgi:hypothetical protein